MSAHILITGGAGFIGSFLVDHFLARGDAVRVLDVLDSQVHATGPPAHPLPPDVELEVADVRDSCAVRRALQGIDVVVHCAAAVGVGQSLYRSQHYADTNVGGTAALLDALAERRQPLARLVVLTSMTSYGEGLYRRPSDGTLRRVPARRREDIDRYGWDIVDRETREVLQPVPTPEDAELLGRNVYALTKRYEEELALALGDVHGFPVACLRLFNVYGPRQSLSNPYTGVLAIFLGRLLGGHRPVVYEDGRQTRDFVSVHDVVRAVDLAVTHPGAVGQVFNVGTGVGRAIGDIARTLARLLGCETRVPTPTGEFRTGDIRHCLADTTRIAHRLGFVPTVDWESGLSELIEWARTMPPAVDGFARAEDELRAFGLVR